MIIKVRINKDKMYKLCEWNAVSFAANPILKLQTDDLKDIKETFDKIENIEIYQAGEVVLETRLYNTFSNISFSGKVYVTHENIFADCLEVTLAKSSLVEQVQKIQEQLDNVIDIESMTVEEYKQYVLGVISTKCQEDIYAGDYIQIKGQNQYFTYYECDQTNLLQLFLLTRLYPNIQAIPFHPSGGSCQFYTADEISTIYMTLILRLLRLITYINQLNCYVRTLTTKEELARVEYGMELPEPYATAMSEIVSQITYELLHSVVGMSETPEEIPNDTDKELGEEDSTEDNTEGTTEETVNEDNSETAE